MGYCMWQMSAWFCIDADKKELARQAALSLVGQETRIDAAGRHFRWMGNEWQTAPTLEALLAAWHWRTEVDEETGNINGIHYTGEKSGDDFLLFQAIAPFVRSGSFIIMQGEDHRLWAWRFSKGRCKAGRVKLAADGAIRNY